MDMNRITGLLVSGFAAKAYAGLLAIYVASEAWGFVSDVMETVGKGLGA